MNLYQINSIAKGLIKSLYTRSKYKIKRGYKHRTLIDHYDDTQNKEEWQKEVYQYGRDFLLGSNGNKVMDIGCGSGYKLIKYFNDFETYGLEIEPTLSWLKNQYPSRAWIDWTSSPKEKIDLVICADVIEHVSDPSSFLKQINEIDFEHLILSTPERNTKRGRFHYGPPNNLFHYREWNMKEFYAFISDYFDIVEHTVINRIQCTQLILCIKKQ